MIDSKRTCGTCEHGLLVGVDGKLRVSCGLIVPPPEDDEDDWLQGIDSTCDEWCEVQNTQAQGLRPQEETRE